MKKCLFIAFLSVLYACADKHCLEAQPYAVETLGRNVEILRRQIYAYKDSIKRGIEYKFKWEKTWTNLLSFEDSLKNLDGKLSESWRPNPKISWTAYISLWKEQVMPIHQHFESLFTNDSLAIVQQFSPDFKQKIVDFPRALAQIERELLANPNTKWYWFRYVELVYWSWLADLYEETLNVISLKPCTATHFELLVNEKHKFNGLNKTQQITMFILPECAESEKAQIKLKLFGKEKIISKQGETITKIKLKHNQELIIPMEFDFIQHQKKYAYHMRKEYYFSTTD